MTPPKVREVMQLSEQQLGRLRRQQVGYRAHMLLDLRRLEAVETDKRDQPR